MCERVKRLTKDAERSVDDIELMKSEVRTLNDLKRKMESQIESMQLKDVKMTERIQDLSSERDRLNLHTTKLEGELLSTKQSMIEQENRLKETIRLLRSQHDSTVIMMFYKRPLKDNLD